MQEVLALRAYVPARDLALSIRFYEALGFAVTHRDAQVVGLKLEGFSFILQDRYVAEWADNCMLQLMVRDATEWWTRVDADALVATFGVRPPRPPAMQPWGMKVGYLFDPSGVLWHVTEALF